MNTFSSGAAIKIQLASLADTRRLAHAFLPVFSPYVIFFLEGDLGAGKSTLAREMLRAMDNDPDLEVPSPTFLLSQTYAVGNPKKIIHHMDVYRINDPQKIIHLDLEDAIDEGSIIVEWGEKFFHFFSSLSEDCVKIHLKHATRSNHNLDERDDDEWRLAEILLCGRTQQHQSRLQETLHDLIVT